MSVISNFPARWIGPRTAVALLSAACGLLSLSSLSAQNVANRGAKAPADAAALLRFIPENSVLAVTATPKAILTQPDMALFPHEVITAAGLKELGFDPLDIERIVAFVEQPADLGGPPGFGAVLRFTKPYGRENLLPMLLRGSTETTLDDKPLYRAAAPILPSVYLYDARTIVIAPELSLTSMLAERTGESPVVTLLRPNLGKYHLSVVANLDPLRPMINGAMGVIPPVPPEFEKFLEIPNLVTKVEVHVKYGVSVANRLVVHAADENGAQRIEALLNEGLVVGQRMLIESITADMPGAGEDPVAQATIDYMRRLMGHFAAMIQPKRESTQVVVSMESEMNVATTGVLVALLLPAVQAAREAARRASSSNNLKQIGLAMHNYHDVHKSFPAAASYDADGKPLLSWRVHILPFLDANDLYEQFHLDEPWDSEHNRSLIERIPGPYRSPSNPDSGSGATNYLLPIGDDTVFGEKHGVGLNKISDGTSNTILAMEVNNESTVIWTKPDDLKIDPTDPRTGLLGLRPGGFNAAFCDGSVRFIAESIDLATLRALFTKSGGEAVDNRF